MKRIAISFLVILYSTISFAQRSVWLHADSVKSRLSAAPNFYEFTGGYGRYHAVKGNCSIDITYNTKTKEVSTITCQVAVDKLHPNMWDAKDIFKFYSAIDRKVSSYYRERYPRMIEDKRAYEDTEPYVDNTKAMKFTFDHNLFDARKAIKNNPDYRPGKGTIYLNAEIDRLL